MTRMCLNHWPLFRLHSLLFAATFDTIHLGWSITLLDPVSGAPAATGLNPTHGRALHAVRSFADANGGFASLDPLNEAARSCLAQATLAPHEITTWVIMGSTCVAYPVPTPDTSLVPDTAVPISLSPPAAPAPAPTAPVDPITVSRSDLQDLYDTLSNLRQDVATMLNILTDGEDEGDDGE